MPKVLLINQKQASTTTVEMTLLDKGFDIVKTTLGDRPLPALLDQHRPDVAVYDISAPTSAILRDIRETNDNNPLPVVMFTDDDSPEMIREAAQSGVFSYIVDHTYSIQAPAIIEIARARFQDIHSLKQELQETKLKLSERKQVEKAKGILMRQHQLSETDAYAKLRKMAMDRKVKMAELAGKLIEAEQLLG